MLVSDEGGLVTKARVDEDVAADCVHDVRWVKHENG